MVMAVDYSLHVVFEPTVKKLLCVLGVLCGGRKEQAAVKLGNVS